MCIPAGRRGHMEILLQLLTSQHYNTVVDRVQFWMNTLDEADLAWMHDYKTSEDPNDWVELIRPPKGTVINPGILWHSVCKFYRYARDADTVYVKVDDDICAIDNPGTLRRLPGLPDRQREVFPGLCQRAEQRHPDALSSEIRQLQD